MQITCSMYFENICREIRLYYAGFGSSRLQIRTKLGENSQKHSFLGFFFEGAKMKNDPLCLYNLSANLLKTP